MLFEGNERREKEREMKAAGRLPPGQSLTLKWPVLHYGSVPRFDPERWDFKVYGLVANPTRWTWSEFGKLPRVETHSDFHCVTRWSRFDNRWSGVAMREILRLVQPRLEAAYVLVHAEQGYTANVPLADLDRDNVLIATHHDGEPLSPDHGFPARLIVLHLYTWKSVKWVRGFEFLDHDQAGFLGAERISHLRRSVEGAEALGGVVAAASFLDCRQHQPHNAPRRNSAGRRFVGCGALDERRSVRLFFDIGKSIGDFVGREPNYGEKNDEHQRKDDEVVSNVQDGKHPF